MDRVVQLGGQPMPGPAEAADRSYTGYRPPPADATDLPAMIADSLAGERAAIHFYRDLFDKTRDVDPVTAEIARRGAGRRDRRRGRAGAAAGRLTRLVGHGAGRRTPVEPP
jgi:hypothetical protein